MAPKVHPYLALITKADSGEIKVLSLKGETVKLMKEYVEFYLCDLSLRKDFLNKISKGQTIKKI